MTGGGTGICRGIALAFASAGCNVAISSRKQEHLEPTAAEMQRAGVQALALAGDVRDPAAMEVVVAQAATFGRLDIVVNGGAAGNFFAWPRTFRQTDPARSWTSISGTFNVSRAAFRTSGCEGRHSQHPATLQLLGSRPGACISRKGRVDALTRARCGWGRPASCERDSAWPVEGAGASAVSSRRVVRDDQTAPLGRLATIDDIARAALFLCSDAASFVTGIIRSSTAVCSCSARAVMSSPSSFGIHGRDGT